MANLEIEITGVTSGLEKSLRDAQDKLQAFSKQAISIGKSLSLAVTAPLTGLATIGILNFDKQAQAIGQIEAALASTGGTAGRTSQELQQIASDLQNITTFGDEEILQKVTAQLLTFTNIAGQQFDRTQKAALDLATRLGGDLQGAAIQLGKALNDPVANLSALSRSGIQFSEDQKTLINSLVETNQLAEAQNLILNELEKQYGGSAEAAAKLGTGPLKQLSNQFGDLLEDVGQIIVQAINPLIAQTSKLITFFQGLSDRTKTVIVAVGAIAASIGPLLLGIGALGAAIPIITAGFAAVKVAFLAITGPIGIALAATIALGLGINSLVKDVRLSDEVLKKQKTSIDEFSKATLLAEEAQSLVNIAISEFGKVTKEATLQTKDAIKAKIEDVKITIAQAKALNELAVAEARRESFLDKLETVLLPGLNSQQKRVNDVQAEGAKETERLTKLLNELTISYFKIGVSASNAGGKAKLTFEEFSKLADLANAKVFAKWDEEAKEFNRTLEESISLSKRLQGAFDSIDVDKALGVSKVLDLGINIDGPPVIEVPEIDESSRSRFIASLREFNEEASNILSNGVSLTIGDFAFSIGEAIGRGESVLKSAGAALLGGIAQILNQLGQAAISIGVGMLAIKKAFTNPFTAIAAGAALIALAGVISSQVPRITQGIGGGSGVGTSGVGQATQFTGGGVQFNDPNREIRLIAETDGAKLKYVIDQSQFYRN
jgi:hypothetical protein